VRAAEREALGTSAVVSHADSSVTARERVAWTVGIGAAWAVAYFGVASGAEPGRARDLTTVLDRHVPFVAGSVWIYLAGMVCPVLPAVVVRSRALFRRTGLAYVAAIVLSAATFAVWPVSSAGLRADLASSGADGLSGMALRTLYALDPPTNLCPSIHVALGALAALAIVKAVPQLSLPAIAMVALVAASVCTVKQHFVLDVVGGLLLAAAAAPLIVAQAPARTRMRRARRM